MKLLKLLPIVGFFMLLFVFSELWGEFVKSYSEELSPNGKYEAVVEQINGGATTNYTSHVMVNKRKERDILPWNNRQSVFDFVGVHSQVQIVWKRDNNLVIRYDICKRSDILGTKDKWLDIEISYEDSCVGVSY